jgi:SAM-dependent MidA family methyltransferase
MCHYRHHAHDDPFYLPGLQDMTAHVDFTTVMQAASDAGLQVASCATQAKIPHRQWHHRATGRT